MLLFTVITESKKLTENQKSHLKSAVDKKCHHCQIWRNLPRHDGKILSGCETLTACCQRKVDEKVLQQIVSLKVCTHMQPRHWTISNFYLIFLLIDLVIQLKYTVLVSHCMWDKVYKSFIKVSISTSQKLGIETRLYTYQGYFIKYRVT